MQYLMLKVYLRVQILEISYWFRIFKVSSSNLIAMGLDLLSFFLSLESFLLF